MIQPAVDTFLFRMKDSSYRKNRAFGWLTLGGFWLCALGSLLLMAALWPHYDHTFTPYLKWQDTLVGLLGYITFVSLAGSIMVARYLHALRMGYSQEMIILADSVSLTVRDLSYKNLGSIFWVISTLVSCFITTLVALTPLMLIGWTMSWSHPVLAVLGTGVAVLLSIVGVVVVIPMISVLICALISCISFCRKMGSAQTYRLNSHTSLMISGLALSILSPGEPESLIELDLLSTQDQELLLALLHERWINAERSWNPELGEEIAAALEEARQQAVLAY